MCDIAVLKDEHNKFNAEYMKNEKSIHQLIEEQEIECKTFLVPSMILMIIYIMLWMVNND